MYFHMLSPLYRLTSTHYDQNKYPQSKQYNLYPLFSYADNRTQSVRQRDLATL